MKKTLYLLVALLISSLGYAQVDTLYIRSYSQKLMLSGFFGKDFLSMDIDKNDEFFSYMPNNPVKLGLGISWKNSILSVSGGYGFGFLRDKNLGKTKSLDLQYHHYDRKFIFDFFMQRYKGFYMENDNAPNEYELYPDLSLQQYGMNAQYIFNNKKFSYKAAFVQNEKQVRSAGSLLVGVGIFLTKMQSEGSLIYNEKDYFDNFQFGVNAGYAYSWVINKHWFVNGSLTTGINFGSEKISTFGKEKLKVYPTVFPRISVGFDQNDWALGISYVNNITFPSFTDESSITLLSGTVKVSYIRRIHDFPFLSRVMKALRLDSGD